MSLNQLKITAALVKHLENLISASETNFNTVEREVDKYEGQVKEILETAVEDGRQSIAAMKDFIYRATHNEYGDPIK